MRIATTIAEIRAWRAEADRAAGGRAAVGLVPTMGYLHAGHVSLVARARAENARVAASVFVNPAQFNSAEDLARYPRDPERDAALLRDAGCDIVLMPDPAEVYPPGFQTWVDVGPIAAPLEGAHRPGHFRGVATVVLKLFGIFEPARAYFGQKDYQQLAVIRTLVRDLDVPVDVVGCPTVREADGLAMSSRNARLGPDDRRAATVLHRALRAAEAAWAGGERDAGALRARMAAVFAQEPRAAVEYVSVADAATLEELEAVRGPALLSVAAVVGPVRLIDNIVVREPLRA
ncbi:pantoate--beta-alanine ligase [bacterium]|nr:MAG: pantoate--beta-alanine ligase [bacterium]